MVAVFQYFYEFEKEIFKPNEAAKKWIAQNGVIEKRQTGGKQGRRAK